MCKIYAKYFIIDNQLFMKNFYKNSHNNDILCRYKMDDFRKYFRELAIQKIIVILHFQKKLPLFGIP